MPSGSSTVPARRERGRGLRTGLEDRDRTLRTASCRTRLDHAVEANDDPVAQAAMPAGVDLTVLVLPVADAAREIAHMSGHGAVVGDRARVRAHEVGGVSAAGVTDGCPLEEAVPRSRPRATFQAGGHV